MTATLTLRPRQEKALQDLRIAYGEGCRAPILVAPTGFGKTAAATEIVRQAVAKGKRVWFLAHIEEILDDTAIRLLEAGIDFGWIRAGSAIDHTRSVYVVSVKTAANRWNLPKPDLIIVDECHLAIMDTYVRTFERAGSPLLLGLTGTPQRLDNRGLIEVFDKLVHTCTTFELIEEKLLAPIRLFNPGSDVDDLGKPKAVGDALTHWKRLCHGRHGVAFCMSVQHAEDVANQWRRAGYRAMAIHGKSPRDERKRAVRELRAGQLDLVACAKLWIAGVDVPSIDAIVWLRRTASLVDWLQGNGRGLRLAPGKKDLIILDHVGNSDEYRLGNPLIEHEWSLHGHAKRKRETALSVKACPQCFAVMNSQKSVCPDCGHVFVVQQPRELEHVDGELVEVMMQRRERKREQGSAQTVEELAEVGRRRGMKNPRGWARHVLAARMTRAGG